MRPGRDLQVPAEAVGRAGRFAKVGGEMVPLGTVEELVARLWPERGHAVVALPDARKGEALMLVTEQPGAERAALISAAREQGVPELFVPRRVVVVGKLPWLGTGKPDYMAARKLAEAAKAGSESRSEQWPSGHG